MDVELSGRCPFADWQAGLPPGAQAAIDVRLLQMAGLKVWTDKYIKKYKTTKKIYELRIPHNKVQYRPLGTYAPGRSFVLLEGAIERGGKIPKQIIERAEQRQTILEGSPSHVREHRYN